MRVVLTNFSTLFSLALILIFTGLFSTDSLAQMTPEEKKQEADQILKSNEEVIIRMGYPTDPEKLERALELSKEIEYDEGQKQAIFLLYSLYKRNGEFEKAATYHLEYLRFKDELFEKNINQIKEEYESTYNPKNKEAEINLLKSQNEIESLNLSRKRWILFGSLSGLFFFVIIIFLVFKRNRTKQAYRKSLSSQNEKFNRANEELTRINQELEQSEHDQRKLNQTKDRFFSLISQELRKPLNSLSDLLQILINEAQSFSKAEINELAIKINNSVNSLLELIENLLQWSRVQMNQLTYTEEDVPINPMIRESIQLLKSQADIKHIGIEFEKLPEVTVKGDRNMIYFIIRNLLLNNIKFGPESSKISFKKTQVKDWVEILISMDNQLMEFDQMKDIWLSKTNIEESMIRDEKTSLGLILTRYFIEKNSGQLMVDQDSETTRIKLSLPSA